MRKLLLIGALLASSNFAQAAVITESGTVTRAGQSTENGYILVYNFAPLAISGQITNVQVDFTGFVSARIGGAADINIGTGNTITSVSLTPMVSFANSLLPGETVPVNPLSGSFVGTPTTEAYDNANNVSVSPSAQAVTLTSSVTFAFPANTFASTLPVAVDFFAGLPFSVLEPAGSTANFPGGGNYDRSSGVGSLLLTVTYTPVPEPASLAVLGVGLLGALVLRRSRTSECHGRASLQRLVDADYS